MPSQRITIQEAETNFSKHIVGLRAGDRIVVCRRNEPLAEIRPYSDRDPERRKLGQGQGLVKLKDSFFDPLPDDLLDLFEGRGDDLPDGPAGYRTIEHRARSVTDGGDSVLEPAYEGPVKLLLDTVVFIWIAQDVDRLGRLARNLIEDSSNELYLSAASGWEIAIKHSIGRLELQCPPRQFVEGQRQRHRIASVPIDESDALGVSDLPNHHKDPFDRILIAQAIRREMSIVTPDKRIQEYSVRTVW